MWTGLFVLSIIYHYIVPFYDTTNQSAFYLRLRVQPRASKDGIEGILGEVLKVCVTAAPVEGKANTHLLHFLSKTLSLKRSQIRLVSGANSQNKRVKISDLTPQEKVRLSQWCRKWEKEASN